MQVIIQSLWLSLCCYQSMIHRAGTLPLYADTDLNEMMSLVIAKVSLSCTDSVILIQRGRPVQGSVQKGGIGWPLLHV